LDSQTLALFTGNANPALAQEIARHLMVPLGRAIVGRFSDGEVNVELMENVRGRDVFLVQPTCPPVNDHLMELLVMADACRRASSKSVTAVVPYMGYSRQDRRPRATRSAISAKLVANMMTEAGIDRVLTVDLHAEQIQGFFDIPVDNVYASPVLLGDAWRQGYQNMIVVSPDVGGVVRARALAKRLDDIELAIIDKRRPRPNESKVMNIIGPLPRGSGPEGRGRGPRRCLHHPSHPLRQGRREDRQLRTRPAGGDRHHPARRCGRQVRADPPAFGGGSARRDDTADQGRGVRELAVRRLMVRSGRGTDKHQPGATQ
jgi:hypothetical protein